MTIDWWTLAIQAVNITILVWLLGRFFWRPVAGMIADRQAATARMLAEAEAARQAAAAGQAEIAATRAGLAAEHDRMLADTRAEAEALRAGLLKAAEAEAEAARARGAAALEHDRAEAERAWSDSAADLAVAIAGRLLARQDPAALCAGFLEGLAGALAALPAVDRAAAAAPEAVLTATSATPLAPAETEAARRRIAAALGAEPRIEFAVDPALLAGLELAGPGFAVRNSWRADLATIRAELAHHDDRT